MHILNNSQKKKRFKQIAVVRWNMDDRSFVQEDAGNEKELRNSVIRSVINFC